MYKLESGKETFLNLLERLATVLDRDTSSKVTSVGLVIAPVNGALTVSVNFEDTQEHLKERNSSDFKLAHVLEFGESDSPMKEWSEEYWKQGMILLTDGSILRDWGADTYFARPIMDEVCRWVDEYFQTHNSPLSPIWIVVDEIDSGCNKYWQVGRLADAKS